jgi:collagen type VII alpha
VGAAVSYAGTSYVALVAGTGREPDSSPLQWGLLAQAGAAGPQGPQGVQGLEGPTGYPGPAGSQGVAGPAGPQGPVGPVGATGPAGSTGVAGPQGPSGASGLAYRGAYGSSTNYGLNDGVVFGGSTYISLAGNNAGNSPDQSPAFWGLLAAQGSAGTAGTAGTNGMNGPAGATGPAGPAGPTGLAGPAGANGTPGLVFQGTYSAATNYSLNDAVSYQGSSWISLEAGNHGNAPNVSPSAWATLASVGATGVTGPPGSAGPAGAAGAQGPAGPQGATGSAGAAGIYFRGPWTSASGYAANDAVTFGGSTYLAQQANNSVEPDTNPGVWSVLAAAGGAGPTGAAGAAATVAVGTVTTGAAGTQAQVTNSGTATAAVLNFLIPQGADGASGTGGGGGGSGGSGTSGVPFAAMYHAVSYSATYYSVNNTNQSANETASVLTWVPAGCSATKLVVYSQQAATITVTLRTGMPGAMADSALSCQVSTGASCTSTGAVTVPTGGFIDIGITHPDSNPVGVWTAVSCN